MAGARWTALAVVAAIAALVVGIAGCGSSGRTTLRRIAIVTPGRGNDVDWTLLARGAFESIAERQHLTGEIADGSATRDLPGLLERLSHDGAQLVIAHDPKYATAAAAIAARTKVPELVWGDASLLRPGRVGVVNIDVTAAGYIAGVLAARSTILRRLGIIVADDGTSWELRNWYLIAGGFIAGARATDPGVKLSYARAGTAGHGTPEDVRRAGRYLAAHGAPQMFAALGGRSPNALLENLRNGDGEHQLVGVIGDKATIDTEQLILTSITFNFRRVFAEAIRDVRTGRFGTRGYTLTLANGGVSLLATGRTPSDAYEAAVTAKRKIENREIDVPVTPTEAEVLALLHERR